MQAFSCELNSSSSYSLLNVSYLLQRLNEEFSIEIFTSDMYVIVLGGKNCQFFGKFCVLSSPE